MDVSTVRLPKGFSLDEADADILGLVYEGETVATFSAAGVKPEEIERAAEEYLLGLFQPRRSRK